MSILSLINQNIDIIENYIKKYSSSSLFILNNIINYSIENGKYIRAKLFLLLLGYRYFDFDKEEDFIKFISDNKQIYFNDHFIGLASILEMIHTATILHDDVIDSAKKRRYKASSNIIFNNKKSILTGDFLLSKALNLISNYNDPDLLNIISKAMSNIIEGEIAQLQYKNTAINLSTYYQIITNKTAELFKLAALCAYYLKNKTLDDVKDLNYQVNYADLNTGSKIIDTKKVGKNISFDQDFNQNKELFIFIGLEIGIIFQIIDDVLDYFSDYKKIGKNIFNDFFDQKYTLPLILLMQDPIAKKYIEGIFASQNKEKLSSLKMQEIIRNILLLMKKNKIQEQILIILETRFDNFAKKLKKDINTNIFINNIMQLYKDLIKQIT